MAFIEVESVEDDSPAKNPEDRGHIIWNNSQTRMLIAHFKHNPIVWGKQLKENANRQKTKKASSIIIIKITSSFLFRSKSFQSKAAARAPLLMAAILFFPVHEHKECWPLSLMRVSQGFWGTREHWQNIEGNKGTLGNFWEQGNKISKNYSTKTF